MHSEIHIFFFGLEVAAYKIGLIAQTFSKQEQDWRFTRPFTFTVLSFHLLPLLI